MKSLVKQQPEQRECEEPIEASQRNFAYSHIEDSDRVEGSQNDSDYASSDTRSVDASSRSESPAIESPVQQGMKRPRDGDREGTSAMDVLAMFATSKRARDDEEGQTPEEIVEPAPAPTPTPVEAQQDPLHDVQQMYAYNLMLQHAQLAHAHNASLQLPGITSMLAPMHPGIAMMQYQQQMMFGCR
jgi:hypothetical protein